MNLRSVVYYSLLLVFTAESAYCVNDENDGGVGQRAPSVQPKSIQLEHPKRHPSKIEVKTLPQEINYAYGYENDRVNFEGNYLEARGETKDWFVLVNVHSKMDLNLTNQFDPNKRTLKWATPYENANHTMYKLGDPHSQSALLRDWTGGKFRGEVSFILIPPHKMVEYTIGYAKPQEGGKFNSESGYGLQLRFKNLPEGTIVLDTPLITERQHGKAKAQKTFSLKKLLSSAIESYNAQYKANPIPESLSDPKSYPYHDTDMEAVNEFHIK